jgi:HPt (histidine-containing phosphotransfer) domain-containing protein
MSELINQDTIDSLQKLGEDFFCELVGTFLVCSRNETSRIRRGIEEGDLAVVERAAHSLKGACLGQGAEEMAGLCGDLEIRSARGDLTGAEEVFCRLEEAARRSGEVLSRFLPPE